MYRFGSAITFRQQTRPLDNAFLSSAAAGYRLWPATTALLYAALGISLMWAVALFAQGQSPAASLVITTAAGLLGTIAASGWLRKFPFGTTARFLIAVAFLARVVVGTGLYLSIQDPAYFKSNGAFVSDNWEFRWTYESTSYAADNLVMYGEWRPTVIFQEAEDKNAAIHTWMGWFLAATGARHALDLAPLNSFHNVLAALFLISLALALKYSVRAAFISGILLAWYPWSFPASIMWRDQVGLSWLILAALLLYLGLNTRVLGVILILLSVALAGSVREVYGLVFLAISAIAILAGSSHRHSTKTNMFVGFLVIALLLLSAPTLYTLFLPARYQNLLAELPWRVLSFPLLLIRALVGPFPWGMFVGASFEEIGYSLFDYMYHVLQLGLLVMLVRNIKQIRHKVDLLVILWLGIWIAGVLARGVHTAYLAVAAPFIMPVVFESETRIGASLLLALGIFIFLNAVYVLSGWWGGGFLIGLTGY